MNTKELNNLLDLVEYVDECLWEIDLKENLSHDSGYKIIEAYQTLATIQSRLTEALIALKKDEKGKPHLYGEPFPISHNTTKNSKSSPFDQNSFNWGLLHGNPKDDPNV